MLFNWRVSRRRCSYALYQIGELFQDIAVNRSRRSIKELMDIKPDFVNLKVGDDIVTVSPEKVNVGDIILVKPGERIL